MLDDVRALANSVCLLALSRLLTYFAAGCRADCASLWCVCGRDSAAMLVDITKR